MLKRKSHPQDPRWAWSEGPVDTSQEFLELRFGALETGEWKDWIPAARVGPPAGNIFPVEWLLNRSDTSSRAIAEAVVEQLDFYLVSLGEEDPWAYARYHCGSTSNAYGPVHWGVEPGVDRPTRRAAQVSEQELKLTACVYAEASVVKHLRETGSLPETIGGPWLGIKMQHLIEKRGTNPTLTPDEQLVYEALLRDKRAVGGLVRLIPPEGEAAESISRGPKTPQAIEGRAANPTRRSRPWAVFGKKLTATLESLQEGQFLTLSDMGSKRLVQFAAQGSFGMRIETLSNSFLDGSEKLDASQIAALLRAGWKSPTGSPDEATPELDPEGSPNYFLDAGAPVSFERLANMAIQTLEDILRVAHPKSLDYEAFDAKMARVAIPELGLPQRRSQSTRSAEPPVVAAPSPQERTDSSAAPEQVTEGSIENAHIRAPVHPEIRAALERGQMVETCSPVDAIAFSNGMGIPESSTSLGVVEWSWSPANSREDSLYLSKDERLNQWILWVEWPNEGGGSDILAGAVARCPSGNLSLEQAAWTLVTAFYRSEAINEPVRYTVSSGGRVLSEDDLQAIGDEAWSDGASVYTTDPALSQS